MSAQARVGIWRFNLRIDARFAAQRARFVTLFGFANLTSDI